MIETNISPIVNRQNLFSDLHFFNLSFATIIWALLSWRMVAVDWHLSFSSGFSALSLVIGFGLFLGHFQTWGPIVGLLVFVIQFTVSLFPFSPLNPMWSFNLPFYGNMLFMVTVVPVFVSLAFERNWPHLKVWLVKWAPLFILVACNTWYVMLDFREVSPYDHARHYGNAISVYNILTGNTGGKVLKVFTYYDFYQPLVYITAAPFLWLFGKSYTSACLSLVLFWLPLAYIYCRKSLLHYWRVNQAQASTVALLVVGGSWAVSLTKQFMQDFPALAMLLTYQYFVFRSSFFLRSKPSAWASVIFSLGLLTKVTFLLYGLSFWLFAFYRAWRKSRLPQLLVHLLQFIGITTAIAGIWFLVNRNHYNYELPYVQNTGENSGLPAPGTLESYIWYFPHIPKVYSYWVFGMATFGIIAALFWQRKNRSLLINSGICFMLVMLASTMVRNKEARTILCTLIFAVPFLLLPLQVKMYRTGRVLMFLSLLWILDENITLGTGHFDPFTKMIGSESFTLEASPGLPNIEAPNKTQFVFQQLFHQAFIDSAAPPMDVGTTTNVFYDRSYGIIYQPQPQLQNRVALGKETLLFSKDYYWQDYYMFSIKRDSNFVVLTRRGSQAELGGDLFAHYEMQDSEGHLVQDPENISLAWSQTLWKRDIPPKATQLKIYLYMHHSYPKSSYAQIVYALAGDTTYTGSYILLEIYQPSGPRLREQMFILDKL